MAVARERIEVPRAPWENVRTYFARQHKLGEHVSIEGPTGSGKTLLGLLLLEERGKRTTVNRRPIHITVFCNKNRDATTQLLVNAGWPRIRTLADWPPPYGSEQVVLWPAYGDPETVARRQAEIFGPALREIFSSGNQIAYVQEAQYFSDPQPDGLGLRGTLTRIWGEARSSGLTMIADTQRPVAVPVKMWTEPYWLFLFRPEDEDDLKLVAARSGHKQLVLDVLPTLDTHEFLMLRRRPEQLAVISEVKL